MGSVVSVQLALQIFGIAIQKIVRFPLSTEIFESAIQT